MEARPGKQVSISDVRPARAVEPDEGENLALPDVQVDPAGRPA
jgi:hypothetical protein